MSVEPRALINQLPLPIPSHRCIAIQARSETTYKSALPTRDEIRRDNYNRRLKQLSQQGFRSPINEPYQAIGAPLCLETKKLLLQSLGQPDEVLMNFITFRLIFSYNCILSWLARLIWTMLGKWKNVRRLFPDSLPYCSLNINSFLILMLFLANCMKIVVCLSSRLSVMLCIVAKRYSKRVWTTE